MPPEFYPSLNGSWRRVSGGCSPKTTPMHSPRARGAQPPSRQVHPAPPAPPYLGELGDFLAHFQVQVRAVVQAVPRLLRGHEFGRPGRRAAVIVLLPAHARGRHLPRRPRPGHPTPRPGHPPPRPGGGPRGNGVGEAGAGAAAWGPDTPRPAAGALLPAPPGSPPTRDRAAPPIRGRGRPRRGTDARAGQHSPAPKLAPGGGGGARRSGSHWPRGPARRPRALRREEAAGRAAAGEAGTRRGRGSGGRRYQGARLPARARGRRRHFPAARPRPAPPPTAPHPEGRGGASRRARGDPLRGLPGRDSCARDARSAPRAALGAQFCRRRRDRGHLCWQNARRGTSLSTGILPCGASRSPPAPLPLPPAPASAPRPGRWDGRELDHPCPAPYFPSHTNRIVNV